MVENTHVMSQLVRYSDIALTFSFCYDALSRKKVWSLEITQASLLMIWRKLTWRITRKTRGHLSNEQTILLDKCVIMSLTLFYSPDTCSVGMGMNMGSHLVFWFPLLLNHCELAYSPIVALNFSTWIKNIVSYLSWKESGIMHESNTLQISSI